MSEGDGMSIYELYAVKYAETAAPHGVRFYGTDPHGDPHDGPTPMDYFVWAAVSPERTVVVDTGFTAEVAARRKRDYLRCPVEGLRLLGIDPDAGEDVVISHLHYDHVGSFHRFARARFHLQEREMHYATGRYMCHHRLRHSFEVEDVA